jgi:hypothetical protein
MSVPSSKSTIGVVKLVFSIMNEIYVKSNSVSIWLHKLVEYGLIAIMEGCAIRPF